MYLTLNSNLKKLFGQLCTQNASLQATKPGLLQWLQHSTPTRTPTSFAAAPQPKMKGVLEYAIAPLLFKRWMYYNHVFFKSPLKSLSEKVVTHYNKSIFNSCEDQDLGTECKEQPSWNSRAQAEFWHQGCKNVLQSANIFTMPVGDLVLVMTVTMVTAMTA